MRKRLGKIVLSLIGLGVSLAGMWGAGFVAFAVVIHGMSPPDTISRTDAIVVLTGGGNRVNVGLDLLADEAAGRLFISGVNPQVRVGELIALWRPDREDLSEAITLGRVADDTVGNASETRDWVARNGVKSLRIVTSTYHMPRAMLEFRHALPGVELVFHPVVPADFSFGSATFVMLTFREYTKTLGAGLRILLTPSPDLPIIPPSEN